MLYQLAHSVNLMQFWDQAAVPVQLISTGLMAQSRQKAIFFRARETLRTTTEWLFFSFRKNTWSKDHSENVPALL